MTKPVKVSTLQIAGLVFLSVYYCLAQAAAGEYERRENPDLDYVYVKKDSNFSSYRAVTIDAISIWYPVDTAPPADKAGVAREHLEKAQTLFRQLIKEELRDEHKISSVAGENILRLHAEFIDLRSINHHDQIPVYIASKKFRTAPGHITVVAELSDSVSGEVLARIADLGKKQSSGNSLEVDWEAIETDLRNWAKIFGDWFNTIHPHDDEDLAQ